MTAALTALPLAAARPARTVATAPQGDFAQVLEQVSARADAPSTRDRSTNEPPQPTTVRTGSPTTRDGATTEAEAGAVDDETAAAAAGATGTTTATDVSATVPVVMTDVSALIPPTATPVPAPAAVAPTLPVAPDTAAPVPTTGPAPATPALPTAAPAGRPAVAPTVAVDPPQPTAAGVDRVAAGIDRPAAGPAQASAPVSDDQVTLPTTPAGTTPPMPAADQPTVVSPTPTAVPTAAVVAPTAPAPTTPTAPTVPAVPAQPTPPPLAEQLGARLTALTGPGGLGRGRHILTVPVDPENLGPVRIVAHIGPESVRVELVGATEASREALRGALSDLRRDLAASGLTVDVGPEGGRSDGREPDARGALPRPPAGVPVHEPGTPVPVTPDRPPSRGLDLLA
ncbi:flagellar hook-length control protein FliK [Cellulomonas sp. Root137]|uniref:flagellar hook-length control protein FliK n=1 Tax=Cellulomonas sp. Root137 TaxID=1736459 RepID=UPI0006FD6775|nr:flagellar hook-length control protein FliK [Cellulomonas sp. Root137]KQY45939.1 hypothetical protein ASD18_00105 [Cellulomonas sp. Root137]